MLVDDHASFSIVDNDLGVNDRKIGSNGQQLHKRSAMALGVVARVVLGVARLLGWAIFITSARAGAASGLPRLATSTRSFTTTTTGFTGFAECRLHSAKASLHSANSLPSVTLGKRHSAKPPSAKGSLPSVGFRALGKDFAESLGTRQSSHVAPPRAGTLPSA